MPERVVFVTGTTDLLAGIFRELSLEFTVYSSVSQPFLSCVPPEPICHTMSTPMLMILKKYNVTQVIIKCFHVPPAVCLRTPRGTRTPGWESLVYRIEKQKTSCKQQFCGQKRLVSERGQRTTRPFSNYSNPNNHALPR